MYTFSIFIQILILYIFYIKYLSIYYVDVIFIIRKTYINYVNEFSISL